MTPMVSSSTIIFTLALAFVPVNAKQTRAPDYVPRDSHGRIQRSEATKNEFKHSNPCPSTGKSSGSCPGFVIDHINPLKRGGPDIPSNMQWQAISEAKAKDKIE